MELKDFKNYIIELPEGIVFPYGLSEPFAWRGIYAEVAFDIIKRSMTREEILSNIDLAYTQFFYGYKGGEYTYGDYTEVHFESDYSRCTDGGYTADMIAEIEGNERYTDQEDRLVKLAFCKS